MIEFIGTNEAKEKDMNLDKLNPMQRKAAEQLTGPVLMAYTGADLYQ